MTLSTEASTVSACPVSLMKLKRVSCVVKAQPEPVTEAEPLVNVIVPVRFD
jgi:hypothetical protein